MPAWFRLALDVPRESSLLRRSCLLGPLVHWYRTLSKFWFLGPLVPAKIPSAFCASHLSIVQVNLHHFFGFDARIYIITDPAQGIR